MILAVPAASLHPRNLRTRVPFRYGVVTLTHFPLPHPALETETLSGQRLTGCAADSLPPKWFDRKPPRTLRDNVADRIIAIRAAEDVGG